MKNLMLIFVLMMALGQGGCAFLGGAAVGALGTSAGYEINAKSKMDQLEDDYREYPAENTRPVNHRSRKAPSFISRDL